MGKSISASCAWIILQVLTACDRARVHRDKRSVNFQVPAVRVVRQHARAASAFLSAEAMWDGFYGWLAVPRTHSRQSEQWNFFRTAPLKACDEPSRPTVRWPLGRTDEFERCKRGKSTRSAPTASAPPAPFAWRAQARPQGKASEARECFHGLS